MKITCPCGKDAVLTKDNCFNIVDAELETGFHYIKDWNGGNMWLCNDCFYKAQTFAKKLLAITKNEYIYFSDLLVDRS